MPLRVCIIDDDEIDRLALRRALRDAGYQADVTEISRAREAVPTALSVPCDLVFLDFQLPDGNGLGILADLRLAGVDCAIVVLTAHTSEEVAAQLIKQGASDFMVKAQLSADRLREKLPGILASHALQRQLRVEQERLRAAIGASGTGIWDWDLLTDRMTWDARCRELFGVGPEEPVDYELFLSRLHHYDHARTKAAVRSAMDPTGSGTYDIEYRTIGPIDQQRWIRATGHAYFEGDGPTRRPVRFLGTATDTTRLKRAEQALAEEVALVESLQDVGRRLTTEADRDRILELVTERSTSSVGAAYGAFFYNVEDDQGGSYMLYTLAGAPREAFEQLGQPRKTAIFAPTFDGEATIRFDDVTLEPTYGQMEPHYGMPPGHLPVRSYLATPVRSRTGAVLGGLFMGHPDPGTFTAHHERILEGIASWAAVALENVRLMTAEREARAQTEQALHLRDEVLAIVSHDLRNPLQSISAGTALLRRLVTESPVAQRSIEIIERAGTQMVRLVDDLLVVAKARARSLEVSTEPLDPRALVDEAAGIARPLLRDGVALRMDLAISLPAIAGDRHRLLQVFGNLLANAARYTEAGAITLGAQRAASAVRFYVSDEGPGLDPSELSQVFDRFWQSPRRERGSAGLGLMIVKSVVEAHGGEVSVESAAGAGATFSFTIPAAGPEISPEAGEPQGSA